MHSWIASFMLVQLHMVPIAQFNTFQCLHGRSNLPHRYYS
jgi:hypothetical protein